MGQNFVYMDAEEIGARFLLINVAFDAYKSNPIPDNLAAFETAITNPSDLDVNLAKSALHEPNNSAAISVQTNPPATITVMTCPVCTVNNVPYHGLTPTQCKAMGGQCTGGEQ
jgi:hypothetical protein